MNETTTEKYLLAEVNGEIWVFNVTQDTDLMCAEEWKYGCCSEEELLRHFWERDLIRCIW